MALSVPRKNSVDGGSPVFVDSGAIQSTPGVQQTLITSTVPSGKIRYLQQVILSCRIEGTFEILANGVLVGSGRTGASLPTVQFPYVPPRPFVAGTVITVKLTTRTGSPSASVEAYLQATDVS